MKTPLDPVRCGPIKRELNDYQAANLRWLLRNIRTRLPGLDTGDWFGELLRMTEDSGRANCGDVDFDHRVMDSEFVRANNPAVTGTDIHGICGICEKPVAGKVYVRLEDKYVHRGCFCRGVMAELDAERQRADAAERELASLRESEAISGALLLNHIEGIAQRDRRIAELETALRKIESNNIEWHSRDIARTALSSPSNKAMTNVADEAKEAIGDVAASPATATKCESWAAHALHECSHSMAPAAREVTKCPTAYRWSAHDNGDCNCVSRVNLDTHSKESK